jgi:hypothetical protein
MGPVLKGPSLVGGEGRKGGGEIGTRRPLPLPFLPEAGGEGACRRELWRKGRADQRPEGDPVIPGPKLKKGKKEGGKDGPGVGKVRDLPGLSFPRGEGGRPDESGHQAAAEGNDDPGSGFGPLTAFGKAIGQKGRFQGLEGKNIELGLRGA